MRRLIVLMTGIVTIACNVLAQLGPIHHWPMNGNLSDTVGTNHGTAVGGTVTYTNGMIGQAGAFAGSYYADVGVALSTNAYTKAAWILRTGGSNNNILSGDNTSNRHAFFVPSTYSYQLAAGHNGTWNSVRETNAIPTGVWTHVAVTYDRVEKGGTMRLYRDGQPVAGTAVATNVAPPNGGFTELGGFNDLNNGLVGRIDDAAIWDRALTAAEINQLYQAGTSGIPAGSATTFPYSVYALVPEATNYNLLYSYDIPTNNNLGTTSLPVYSVDRASAYTSGVAVSRVAYFFELYTNGASTARWVYASMDAFTRDPRKLGVPTVASGAQFQQDVTNLNVWAGGNYVTSGTNLTTGNIEFWGYNYSQSNAVAVPNASSSTYDAGDLISTGGSYGSMQLHNHAVNGAATSATIFAYNAWGNANVDDLGIGNCPTGANPDWTFIANAASYTSRTLIVLAQTVSSPTVVFTNRPLNSQVYPRDPLTGGAVVRIDGAVLSSGDTGIALRVWRNGAIFTNQTQALTGSGGDPFAFTPIIFADSAIYSFDVTCYRTSYQFSVLSATGVTVNLPQVTFTNRPFSLQLYPRIGGATTAVVRIDGAVMETGCTALAVTVLRNGAAYTNYSLPLSGVGGQTFSFAPVIRAELAGYDITVTLTCAGLDYTVLSATNVVVGDVLLVSGQSNAEARQFNGSANSNQSIWIRSYGYRTTAGTTVQSDTNWYLAEGDAIHASGAVGQWPLRMARVLMESNALPIAIINHAEGGQPISFFRRNDANPEDTSNNYGQMLYRVRRGGLAGAVRAILWYQGESDYGNAPLHENGWLELYRNWKRDFPTVEKVYVCQLHFGSCGVTADANLRDRQRLWPDRFPDIEVMSTTGLPGHDGCHYAYENGYRLLGEAMARLVLRDLFGASLPTAIAAPNPACAWFTDGSGSTVAVRMRNDDDRLTVTGSLVADFRMEGMTSAVVIAVTASSNILQVAFDRDVSSGLGLSYFGHSGGSTFVTNQLGLGILAFYNLPVQPALAAASLPSAPQAFVIASNRIDLTWSPTLYAGNYLIQRDGVTIGTSYNTVFVDETVVPGGVYSYRLAAASPAGTSAWSAATIVTARTDNAFALVPEAADYDVLYRLDLPTDLLLSSAQPVPYDLDRSAVFTQCIRRVAYFMELQERAGAPLRWVYASMNAFTTNALLLGVPALVRGASFQQSVTDLNVYASSGSGVTPGLHLTSGNIEFWGYSYGPGNARGVTNASSAVYDAGDSNALSSSYGSMQLHNNAVGGGTNTETIFAYNRWSQSGFDDIGIGNNPTGANPDYTFAYNAISSAVRHLTVLVLTDADNDGLPDAWERARFSGIGPGPNDDTDGDGVKNWAEYEAGTDAQNSNDWPRIEIRPGAGGTLVFDSAAGRQYTLKSSTNGLDSGWTPMEAGIPGTGGEITRETTNAAPAVFFRLHVGRP